MAGPEILFLHSQRTPIVNRPIEKAPLLQRELVRQAVLLAARDELGLFTGDAALRETAPAGTNSLSLFAGITPGSGREAGLALGYFLQAGSPDSAGETLTEGRLPMLYEYEQFTAAMEELSRNVFPDLLRAHGFSGRVAEGEKQPVPKVADIEIHLSELNELSQFRSLRLIHQGLREEPDSREFLGVAVRAYANLGQLSREHWSVGHKVFQARSLLYAERLVVREDRSPWSLAHRAYARALVGRHHAAQSDLKEVVDAGIQLPWLEPIYPFLNFNTRELVEIIEADVEASQLAALLACLTVEFSESESETFAAGDPALVVSPYNFRVHSILFRNGGISTKRFLSIESRANFLGHLIESLPEMEEIPGETVKLLAATPPGITKAELRDRVAARSSADARSFWELFQPGAKRIVWWSVADLVESLRMEETNTKGSEPSWSLLAGLIEETNFTLVRAHLHMLARSLGVEVREELQEHLRAETAGHPLASILPTFWVKERRGTDGIRGLLTELNIAEVPMVSLPLIGNHSRGVETFGNMTRREGQMLAVHHGDRVYDDLLMAADYYVSKTREQMLRHLIQISPNDPHTRARLVRHAPELARELFGQDAEQLIENPEAALAVAKDYRARGEVEKAVGILEELIGRMPDFKPHVELAEIYLEQGNEDRWLETLTQFIENGEDRGLLRTRARERIARHFLETGRAGRALPFAAAAAQSWAASALLLAANCYFAAGDMERSLYWFEARHSRYPRPYSRIAVYNWRVKSGIPLDDQGVRELHAFVAKHDSTDYWGTLYHGTFHFYEGDQAEAIALIENAFRMDTETPRLGLVAAMFADSFGLEAERDRLLKNVAEGDPARYSYPESRAASVALAGIFLAALSGKNEKLLHQEYLKKTIESAYQTEKTDLAIIVGHFLDKRGLKDEALRYYRSAIMARHSNSLLEPLLYNRLRALDVNFREVLEEGLRAPGI